MSIISLRARVEFDKMIPSKIDRHHSKSFAFSLVMSGSILLSQSSDRWKSRRAEFTKLVGLNTISEHVPMMIETTDKMIKEWPRNKEFNMTSGAKNIAFEII